MSVISLLNVSVLNNPAKFTEKYSFEITFECLEALSKDLEFKLTYVGSATSSEHDQELDTLLVGPIPVGVNKFVFEADAPDLSKIPASEILGVTVLLLTCSYDGREFVRVGYYVNNEYDADELNAEPPAKVQTDRIVRNILAEKPRVTRFAIKWDSEESAPPEFPPDQPEADLAPDDEEQYAAEELVGDDEDEAGGDSGTVDADAMDEDVEMGGADEDTKDGDDIDEDGDDSEDLEAESEGSDDEEEDEDEGVDEDETMDTSSEHPVQQPAVPGAPGVATH